MNKQNETTAPNKSNRRIRTIIAGLIIASVAGSGIAYASKHDSEGCGSKEGKEGKHEMRDKQNMLPLSSKVIDQLQLNDTQKIVLSEAQAATQTMRQEMRTNMHAAKEARKVALNSDTFDPRALFTQQDAMATQAHAARQSVQKQWLTFWDGLTDQQKTVVSQYMQSKKDSHKESHKASRKHQDNS